MHSYLAITKAVETCQYCWQTMLIYYCLDMFSVSEHLTALLQTKPRKTKPQALLSMHIVHFGHILHCLLMYVISILILIPPLNCAVPYVEIDVVCILQKYETCSYILWAYISPLISNLSLQLVSKLAASFPANHSSLQMKSSVLQVSMVTWLAWIKLPVHRGKICRLVIGQPAC